MSPSSLPRWTACVLRLALSLSNNLLECVLTVLSLTKSLSAISRLLRPCAINPSISNSRLVIASSCSRFSFRANGVPAGTQDFSFDDQFPFDDDLLFSRKLEPEPDAYAGEEHRRQAAVNLDRVFYHDIAIFNDLERRDQQPATKAVDECMNKNLFHVVSPSCA